jgi:hypothetical protein
MKAVGDHREPLASEQDVKKVGSESSENRAGNLDAQAVPLGQ